MDIKPANALSPVLIEPGDEEHEHVAKRQKVGLWPDSVVSALLSLKKSPFSKSRPLRHPGFYSSFPILAPAANQELINHANRIENDHNHISDDEDDGECSMVLTMMALSKPLLPSLISRTDASSIRMSSPVALTSSDPSRKRSKSAHSPAPSFLPAGRPLAAAPACLPRLAPGGERLPTICQLL
jgi:hypothetical protein